MTWQFTPYLIPLFISIPLFLYMIRYAWRRQSAVGRGAFKAVIVAIFLWVLFYTAEIASVSLPAKLFWLKMEHFGILSTPAFWLIFMLRYTKRDYLINPRTMTLLFAPLLFFLVLVWTNEQHHLIWTDAVLDPTGVFRVLVLGPGFWFMLAFLFLIALLASLALLNNLSRSPDVYRKQGVLLLVATFAPMIAGLLTATNLNPLAPLDLMPLSLVISCAAWLYGRSRFRLLDMLPVARATLVEKLTDAVLVLDTQNRVLDLNPAAQRIFGLAGRQAIGHELGELLPQLAAQLPGPDRLADKRLALNLASDQFFDANLIALRDNDGAFYGRILTLHDISASKKNQADLTRLAERLQLAQEIDRAILNRQDPKQIAGIALQYVRQLIPALNRASVLIFDFEAKSATILAAITNADTGPFPDQQVPFESLPMMDHLAQNKHHLVNDVSDLVEIGPIGKKLAQEGIRTLLHVPLLIEGQLIGSLNFGSVKPHAFSGENIELASVIANSLAIAIHQARLSRQTHEQTEQLRRRERYLIRLNEITRTAVSQLESQTMLQTLADSMLGFEDADNCYLTIYDEAQRLATFTAVSGQDKPAFSIIQAKPGQVLLIESVLKAGRPLPIIDVGNTPYVSPEIAAHFPSKSVLALPLIVGRQKLGAATIGFNDTHQFTEDEIQFGAQAAAQIALALSKAQLLEKEREQRQLAELLQESGAALSTTLDVNSVLERLLDQLQRLVPHDQAAVMLVRDGRVTISHQRGYNPTHDEGIAQQIRDISFSLAETSNLKEMADSGRPLIIADVRQIPEWRETPFTRTIRSWAGAPIFQAGKVTAFFSVDKAEVDFYRPRHATRLAALANQASLALENARLYEEAQRQLGELMALHEVAAVGNEASSVDELVDRATEIITETFYPHNFGFLFLDEETGYLHPHASYRVKQKVTELISVPPAQGLIGRVIASGRPVCVDDVQQDEAYLLADPDTRSEVCVPLKVGQKVIGVINAESPEIGAFSTQDERFLLTLARQLSTAIEKIQLLESERSRRKEEEKLRAAISNLSGGLELRQVLDNILVQVEQVVPFDSAALFLIQEDQISLVAGRGFPDDVQVIGQVFPRANPLVAAVEAAKKPICLADAQADGRFRNWGGTTYIRGWLGVPLISHGIVIGLLTMDSRSVNAYGDSEIVLAQAFAHQAAIAIENARLYEAEQQARHLADTLRAANQALTQSLDPVIVGDSLLDYLQQLIPYDSAALMLLQPHNRVILHNVRGFDQYTDETAVQKFTFDLNSNRSLKTVIQSRKSLLIPDTQKFEGWERRSGTGYIRSWLGVPLIAGGQPIGLFSLDKAEPDFFNETHQQLAEALATQTAIALQNAQFFNETRQRADELTLASRVLLSLNATPDVIEVFPQATAVLKQISGCDRATLTQVDFQQQKGIMVSLDKPRETYGQDVSFRLDETAAAADVLSGHVHITNDLREELDYIDAQMFIKAGYLSRINFPLIVGSQVVGSLNLAWRKVNGPTPAQIPLLQQIANAIALAQERSRLFNATNRQTRQLELLNLLSQQVTSQLDSQELYTTVVSTLRQSLDYARVSIFTVDAARHIVTLRALAGPDDEVHWAGQDVYQQKFGEGLIGRVAATGDRVLVNDTRSHPDFLESQRFPIRAELALPLKVGGRVIGVLNIDHDEYDAFSDGDVAILSAVADQLAVSLEKARLIEETRQHAGELETLAEISAAMRAATTVDEIVEALLDQVRFEGNAICAVYLMDEADQSLVVCGVQPFIPDFIGSRQMLGLGIIGHVAQTGEIRISKKLDEDPMAVFLTPKKDRPKNMYGSAALPLRAEDQVVGALHVTWTIPREFTADEVRLLTAVCEIAGSALHRARVMDTLEQRVEERTRELAEAYAQLQELDQLKSRFVADVSHELRTPITNIKLYLDLLAQGSGEKQEHYLSVLNRQADRLVNLLEDILNLSRLDLGGKQVEMAPFDFNALVRQVTSVHEPRLEAANLQLITDLQENLPPVIGERNQISQVVTNLLVNAINYTPEGSVRVKTYLANGRDNICLEISDTGIGIPAEDQVYLFDRFYRGKHASQSNIPGTGLGLAIVKEIVDLHHGRIDFESEAGKGTRFLVTLPVHDGQET